LLAITIITKANNTAKGVMIKLGCTLFGIARYNIQANMRTGRENHFAETVDKSV